ncbi:MAG: T9SS type A sorting domain-containing protein [Bacteroidales bacterium]|nr:T9SS type A sorting domain-containing protein [Bacteroidales bacterium]
MKKKLQKATGMLLLMMVVGSAWGQTLLIENFNYPIGTNLTSVGWTAHSGGGTQPIDVTNGLTYIGYLGSGIGGAANLDNTGEDDNKSFTIQNSGTMYYAFLVNVNVGTAGYFLHLLKSNTTFASRIFVKPSATSGKINFGISNSSTASYAASPTDFDPDVTYLLIVKYDVSATGAGSLWVIPSGVPSTEVLAGTPEHTTTGTGQTDIIAIGLRQYSSTQRIVVDGIRVGNTWTDITGTTWTGTSDHDWATTGNWTNNLPDANVDVLIPSGALNYPTISAAAACNNITIENGANLLGENNLTVNGTATVQKSITGYTGATDGWNVISAPVSGMAMAGSDFVPVTGEDDFYAYDQDANLWRNYLDVANPGTWFDNFDVKTGYLVAYAPANAGTKNFVGALNSDASYVASLSNSNTSWNLIGNPYPSNITWADVTKTAASSAKVLNNSTGSWDDIGTILATGQGLFVYAEGGSSSVTFELGDQTHTAPAKKAESFDQIKFIADFGGKSVSLALVVNESASQSYEWQYDSRYLYPVTTIPYLCAITEDHVWVSKYAFGSQSLESTVIPLYFKVSEEQQITFGLESFTKEIGINKITLEDKVANKLTDLSAGDVYLYTANPNDETDRFVLHVETVTSIDETTHPESVQIYSYGNRVYLRSELNAYGDVTIYNLLGQNVYNTPVEFNGLQSLNLNLNKGWYVVQVVTKQGVKSKKVFIN